MCTIELRKACRVTWSSPTPQGLQGSSVCPEWKSQAPNLEERAGHPTLPLPKQEPDGEGALSMGVSHPQRQNLERGSCSKLTPAPVLTLPVNPKRPRKGTPCPGASVLPLVT